MSPRFRRVRLAVSAALAAAAIGMLTAPAAQADAGSFANPGFEAGGGSWNQFSMPFGGVELINSSSTYPAHSGYWKAELGGRGFAGVNRVSQQVTVPAYRVPVLSFWLRIDPQTPATMGYRELIVEATTQDGTPYLLTSRTNKDSNGEYQKVTLTLPDAFYSSSEQRVNISFMAVEDAANKLPFLIDDMTMTYNLKIFRPWIPPVLTRPTIGL
ncbi:hypothetical protein GCM10010193_09910 [Kitasatospora atroaurantiaca]|uniref:Carbohydrate binding protein n=1 Tax=Kitasatospora atroaurantiaca TaxID=285545 RepID=A0A561ES71_9ACTN|nr:hypothetical protein [Kitasatospora atroaurantiaca]TWE18441.1 hypothetical protein FB465_3515 [Kitasatospora atroaurantiaca]